MSEHPTRSLRREGFTSRTSAAAFPLGGIGTGTFSIGARGEFRDWELGNRPNKGVPLPYTFAAMRVQQRGRSTVTRVLEAEPAGPHTGDSGYHIGKLMGLPRFREARTTSTYPFLHVRMSEPGLAFDVEMEAFTPFVPLDAAASGMPAAVIRYRVTNRTEESADVSVAFSLMNMLGMTGADVFDYPILRGAPAIAFDEGVGVSGLRFTTDLAAEDPQAGTVALVTTNSAPTATPEWPVAHWWDGAQLFWDGFTADGRLAPAEPVLREQFDGPRGVPQTRVGSLAVAAEIAPDQQHVFEFVLAWHLPNRPRAWQGLGELSDDNEDQIIQHRYAARFADAWDVAEQLVARLPDLEGTSRAFASALFDSTIPEVVLEQASTTIASLRSTTCLWLDDGTDDGVFAAWEGSFDRAGSCEGTCTHVWNYAQSVAHLFPRLERTARRTEFLGEVRADGKMNFRGNSVFGGSPHGALAAVDGQLGTIVRLYREWRISGDDDFLRELWPSALRALDYAAGEWDADGDGVLDSRQHNTYDIEFYGPNSLSNSMYIAALRAVARMADHLGDVPRAVDSRERAARCAARTDALLYDGDFYVQRIDDIDEHRYQYGTGCLSDQLFGQTLAHLVGLGHILPREHVVSAIRSVYRHNYVEHARDIAGVQRTYAVGDEGGLVLCSWPHGGRPRLPFVYSDEMWTGVEFQVATHLAFEGETDAAVHLLEAVRRRHDGYVRSPWNHIECGNHYARSLASWGVFLAFSGVQWDAPTKALVIRPPAGSMTGRVFRSYLATDRFWGTVCVDEAGDAVIDVVWGTLDADRIEVVLPDGRSYAASAVVARDSERVQLEGRP